jgi:hypothetical protein
MKESVTDSRCLTGNNAGSDEDMDIKLVQLLESQPRPSTLWQTYAEEKRRICEAILATNAEMSDQEDDNDSDHPNEGKENGFIKDITAALYQHAEKEKRESYIKKPEEERQR